MWIFMNFAFGSGVSARHTETTEQQQQKTIAPHLNVVGLNSTLVSFVNTQHNLYNNNKGLYLVGVVFFSRIVLFIMFSTLAIAQKKIIYERNIHWVFDFCYCYRSFIARITIYFSQRRSMLPQPSQPPPLPVRVAEKRICGDRVCARLRPTTHIVVSVQRQCAARRWGMMNI